MGEGGVVGEGGDGGVVGDGGAGGIAGRLCAVMLMLYRQVSRTAKMGCGGDR